MQELSFLTEPLEFAGIRYCLVGGLAAIAYGRPRLTLDADIVIALTASHVKELIKAFPPEDFREGQSDKHLDDIRAILSSGSGISSDDLNHWIQRLGLEAEQSRVNSN